MANIRIRNLTGTNTNPQSGQYLAIDSSSATQKIDYEVLKNSILAGHEVQAGEDLGVALSDATGGAHVRYNPANRMVMVYGNIRHTGMPTNTALFQTISAEYRPAANVNASSVLIYTSGSSTVVRTGNTVVRSDGTITQSLSSSTTNILFFAAYFI